MRALHAVVEFVTGGSIAAPVGLALGIAVALLLPAPSAVRAVAFLVVVVASFAASTVESPS